MQTNAWNELVELDRAAVVASMAAVHGGSDLGIPTPCAGWDLGDLIAHMTVQQRGFAQAAAGAATRAGEWAPRRSTEFGTALADYAAACDEVIAAFAAVPDPAAPVLLPEIRDTAVPAFMALGFHLVDNVVHAWDAAASLGAAPALRADVLEAALLVARRVPDGPERDDPGAAFAPARPLTGAASPLDEILLLLGRDPGWPALAQRGW